MSLTTILGVFALWNVAVLSVYGIDKLKAKRGNWRIPEATLISLALLMGGVGAMMGMVIFHHKVSKVKFRLLVPLSLLITLAGLVGCICWVI